MESEFSEFSYGFSYTSELAGAHSSVFLAWSRLALSTQATDMLEWATLAESK